jgi:hypothetical protein
MLRRTFLGAGFASTLAACWQSQASPPAANSRSAETGDFQKRMDEQFRTAAAEAEKYFPYPVLKVPGSDAAAAFERIRREGKDTPVLLGGAEGFARMAEVFHESWPANMRRTPSTILSAASTIRHPQELAGWEAASMSKAAESLEDSLAKTPDDRLPPMEENGRRLAPAEVRNKLAEQQKQLLEAVADEEQTEPEMGDWPDQQPQPQSGPASNRDILTGNFFETVYIARLPTRDWTEAPAYLNAGGWNSCPPPEFHVAAFRSWRDRYGAELVSMAGDVVEMRTTRAPANRDDALNLAREMYRYCPDVIDQGFPGLAPLAAQLMAGGWWYFWWD